MENSGIMKKRVRAMNFTYKEKEVLFSLVLKYKHVVENKKTDQVSVNEKMQAWENIAAEFNAQAPNLCTRSIDSLKKFYENKKKEVRKQVAEDKKEVFITGGGKKKDTPSDPNQDLLLSIMNSKTVFGLENPFDSDSTKVVNAEHSLLEFEVESLDFTKNVPQLEDTVDEELETEKTTTGQVPSQWKRASSLSTPISESLKRACANESTDTPRKKASLATNRRRPTTTVRALSSSHLAEKYEELLDRRLAIAEYEKEKLVNTLKYQAEENKLRMELLKIQIEVEKKKL